MTVIELELISDINMHLFIEKRMRGGIFYISKRHSKANNKYMKYYDEYKDNKFTVYLDANNLNVWAMSQYLPYGRLKSLNQKEINKFCLKSIEENSSIGFNILMNNMNYTVIIH